MTTSVKYKKLRVEEDPAAQGGDNRRAGDTDGNKAVGDHKSPGVTKPEAESREVPKRTK